MPDELKPTPTPWKTCGAHDGNCPCCQIWSTAADCCVAVAIRATDESYTSGEGVSDEEALVNAKHIAKCVNLHSDLISACQNALDALLGRSGADTDGFHRATTESLKDVLNKAKS